ncbi:hypothetical protein JTB14_028868 [Gonioctena quinquepunctata]|nr:hypothetical protein JTB14_028868 [Gonioctena quinquepunctata]
MIMLDFLKEIDNQQQIDTRELGSLQEYIYEMYDKSENSIGIIHLNIRSLRKHFGPKAIIVFQSVDPIIHVNYIGKSHLPQTSTMI